MNVRAIISPVVSVANVLINRSRNPNWIANYAKYDVLLIVDVQMYLQSNPSFVFIRNRINQPNNVEYKKSQKEIAFLKLQKNELMWIERCVVLACSRKTSKCIVQYSSRLASVGFV